MAERGVTPSGDLYLSTICHNAQNLFQPQISIKEERADREEEDDAPSLELKHSLFSASTTIASSSLHPTDATSSSGVGGPPGEGNTSSSVAGAAGDSDGGSSYGDTANNSTSLAPGNLNGIIGSDGRIDLNFYLQQAIQCASMPCPLCKKVSRLD